MFAVAGTWILDARLSEHQTEVLRPLVEHVRQHDGSVRGFWSHDVDQPTVALTFVVFQTHQQARASRNAAVANAPAQDDSAIEKTGLRIVDVQAEA